MQITAAPKAVIARRAQEQLRDAGRDRSQRQKKNPVPGSAGIEVGGRHFIDRMPHLAKNTPILPAAAAS